MVFKVIVVVWAVFVDPVSGVTIERERQNINQATSYATAQECSEALLGNHPAYGSMGSKLRAFIHETPLPDGSYLRAAAVRLRCARLPVPGLPSDTE